MNMNYARFSPSSRNFVLNLARSLLKEILCIHYHFKALQYEQTCQIKYNKSLECKYVQVNLDRDQSATNLISIGTDCIHKSINDQSECSKSVNPDSNDFFRL